MPLRIGRTLKKLGGNALDFFFPGLGIISDLVGDLFKIDIPEPPASVKNEGKVNRADLKQNQPNLGGVKTDGYGRWVDWYPLINGYTEFVDNEQVYKAYMHASIGHAELLELRIGNAPLPTFPGQRSEVLLPGEPMTLVHPNVYTCPDVETIDLRGGIDGTIQLVEFFYFGPSTGPAAGADRIRGKPGSGLRSIPVGAEITISGSDTNDGTYTVTDSGTVQVGFVSLHWIEVDSTLTEEAMSCTIEYPQEDPESPTVKAEDVSLIFDNDLGTIEGPAEELDQFVYGDLILVDNTASNDIEFTVLGSGDGTLTVTPAPTNESADPATIVLVRRRAGPFPACLEGDKVNRLGFDAAFAEGLCGLQDDGKAYPRTVTFEARWREIDDYGSPLSGWTTATFSSTNGDTKPYRESHYVDIDPPARVEADLRRVSLESSSDRIRDAATWAGLRGYVVAKDGQTPADDADCTRVAVIVRSSGRLSRQQQRTVNGTNQRLLPVWNGTTWSAPQATRNPAWAFAYWMKAHSNGVITDAQLDLAGLLAFAEGCESRGDTFDAAFESEVLLWEGAKAILRVARAKPYLDVGTGKFSVYRDEETAPTLLFADGINIQLGPLAIDTPTADTPSGVRVKFTDPETWSERADGPVAGSDADPREVSVMGLTSWGKAWEEAAYEWADLRYRVQTCSGETEMEGLLARLGKRVLVGSAVKGWGQVAEVRAADELQLTLWPAPIWTAGAQHYVHLQGPDGLPTARINCSLVGTGVIELAGAPGITLRTGAGWQTIALIGHDAAGEVPASGPRVAIVETPAAAGLREGSLQLRLEDLRVHDDPGEAPEDPYATTGSEPSLAVADFVAEQVSTRIYAEWTSNANAIAYEVEQKLDPSLDPENVGWERMFFGLATDRSWLVKPGLHGDQGRIRAYGDGGRIGAWSQVAIT